MAEVRYNVCDISGCTTQTEESIKVTVIFDTEQTEGRRVEPYLALETLDICPECKQKMIDSGKFIQASGAQGYNTYIL